jgi:predicted methyltransferase
MKTKALLAALILAVPAAYAAAPPAYVTTAVQSAARPADDTARDAARHPAELVAFAGIKPGDTVADIMPGGGYFTRIFSGVVGTNGHVYAVVPAEFVQKNPKATDKVTALAAEKDFTNVSVVTAPLAGIATDKPLDVAWTSDNYHDATGYFGKDQALAMDKAVFKALKPGGVFIVIDHAAQAGSGDSATTTLHRIDPALVLEQAKAAGFKLEGKSQLLANPADTHDKKVFDETIRGHTDQFVFKFRKPK